MPHHLIFFMSTPYERSSGAWEYPPLYIPSNPIVTRYCFSQKMNWNKCCNSNSHGNERITLEKHTPEEHFQCSEGNLLHSGTDKWNSLQSCSPDDQFSLISRKRLVATEQEIQSIDACYFPLSIEVSVQVCNCVCAYSPSMRRQLQHQLWRGRTAWQSLPQCTHSTVSGQSAHKLHRHRPPGSWAASKETQEFIWWHSKAELI